MDDEPEERKLEVAPETFAETVFMCRGSTRGEWFSNQDLEKITGVSSFKISKWSGKTFEKGKNYTVPSYDVAIEFLRSLGYEVYIKQVKPDIGDVLK